MSVSGAGWIPEMSSGTWACWRVRRMLFIEESPGASIVVSLSHGTGFGFHVFLFEVCPTAYVLVEVSKNRAVCTKPGSGFPVHVVIVFAVTSWYWGNML